MTGSKLISKQIAPEQLFMGSVMLVNAGNYLYNLILGRFLGPEVFAEAALLVTMLLIVSFAGMTFQIATTKFTVILTGQHRKAFLVKMMRLALILGAGGSALILMLSDFMQSFFNTSSSGMFFIFGLGIPVYFAMCINRGYLQGRQQFGSLSLTYQTEMWSRLLITLLLLFVLPWNPVIIVALGIVISFIFGIIPFKSKDYKIRAGFQIDAQTWNKAKTFLLLTAGYELTQILINNSDVLLVKHFFGSEQAGLYASIALIGRVVYFIAWMFVMLLLPDVLQKKKQGLDTNPVLLRNISYVGILSFLIVLCCYLFPELIISLMFGEAYLSAADLLWHYALATSLFALSNIFAYYFLSLDRYTPVILSGLVGVAQMGFIIIFHSSLELVVGIQIVAMFSLLVFQGIYYLSHK
ncbi:sugar isomerase [Flavobacteriaceae bacterium D16]|nr:sugar isomerase [Flavobacteriaceae bacterium D16]